MLVGPHWPPSIVAQPCVASRVSRYHHSPNRMMANRPNR
ncbi:hypothetical protein B224_p00010 (plasmid) [Aeromonas media WS]|nr:hypothetical protein B224_p00010 [Aeromonas media WS]